MGVFATCISGLATKNWLLQTMGSSQPLLKHFPLYFKGFGGEGPNFFLVDRVYLRKHKPPQVFTTERPACRELVTLVLEEAGSQRPGRECGSTEVST